MSLSVFLWVCFVILTQGWQPLNYIQALKSIISIEDGQTWPTSASNVRMCLCLQVFCACVCARASVLSWRAAVKEEDCEGLRRLTVYARSNPGATTLWGDFWPSACSRATVVGTGARTPGVSLFLGRGRPRQTTKPLSSWQVLWKRTRQKMRLHSGVFFFPDSAVKTTYFIRSLPDTSGAVPSPPPPPPLCLWLQRSENRSQPALVIIPFCVPVSASCLPVISPCLCPRAPLTGARFFKESRVLVWHEEGCRW